MTPRSSWNSTRACNWQNLDLISRKLTMTMSYWNLLRLERRQNNEFSSIASWNNFRSWKKNTSMKKKKTWVTFSAYENEKDLVILWGPLFTGLREMNLLVVKSIFNVPNYLFFRYERWNLFPHSPTCVSRYIIAVMVFKRMFITAKNLIYFIHVWKVLATPIVFLLNEWNRCEDNRNIVTKILF